MADDFETIGTGKCRGKYRGKLKGITCNTFSLYKYL